MSSLDKLFSNNRAWAERIKAREPGFFASLAQQQAPEYLWIGCSDSRVPANQIVGLLPGEIFVHRNVANVVAHSDLNCLSVMQFAVDHIKVKHIIIVGHHGCGGVLAALQNRHLGLVDNWLRHIQDVRLKHAPRLDGIPQEEDRADRLCELNVIEQVVNAARTTVIEEAWRRHQEVTIHGWVYSLKDGLARDLHISMNSPHDVLPTFNRAVEAVFQTPEFLMRRAIYPGSFDPVTNGHLDVLGRAAKLFDEVVIAVALNVQKTSLFSTEERIGMLTEAARPLANVRVACFSGLLMEYARDLEATVVVRGLRAVSDFEFEFQMALMNRKLEPGVETIFLMPREELTYLSSRIVKEIARLGGNVEAFVPPFVAEALRQRVAKT